MNEFESGQKIVLSVIINYGIYLSGLAIFVTWLVRTSLGTKALIKSIPRRTNMPIYLPFAPLIIWLFSISAIVVITERIWPELPERQSVLINNIALCAGAAITFMATFFLARNYFSRRFRGLGFNVRTIPKDFGVAILNLLSVWPLLLLTVIITIYIGRMFIPNFELQPHYELEKIAKSQQFYLRALIVVTTIVIAPVTEELIFRGLFQTMIRSFISRPWVSIFFSSLLFVTVHTDTSHWPALLVLSMCMGYSYEKSGSLFRPIFIHMIFNATSIIAVLYQSA